MKNFRSASVSFQKVSGSFQKVSGNQVRFSVGGGLLALLTLACSDGAQVGQGAHSGGAMSTGGAQLSSGGSGGSDGAGTGGESVLGSGGASGGESSGGASGVGGDSSGMASGGSAGAIGSGGTPGSGGAPLVDKVTRSASTYVFQHYPIEAGASGVWNGSMTPGTQATSTTFDTVILENGYLSVTILPDYGGRVLSVVHKPTGRELLYQNPIGTPYLMYEDIFYYDYLVILGGIFPSFPEPEHGRYWNLPYQFEVVSESPEAITVRMTRKDDLDVTEGVPDRYDVGRTDVLVELDVTLRAGRSNLELSTQLTNTKDSPVSRFEYWTVTTLAPGSTPGETKIPANTRILADMEQVHLLESSWPWFGSAEVRVSDEVFTWDNLSYFENWVEQGTAFANPRYEANWSGLINYDNQMGTLRVSDNVETPGLKLWTFGVQSLDVDIDDSSEWLRPTIEMWHGVTPEFWDRGTMAANEVRSWTDNYFLTMGLEEVTAASEYGAMHLTRVDSGSDAVLSAITTLTVPDQSVHAVLRLDGVVVSEEDVVVQAAEATTVSATVDSSLASPGVTFEAEFSQGETVLLSGQIALQ